MEALHVDPPLWFEPALEPVSAGDTELLFHWRITHRGPEQNAQECGRENHDGDFTEIHWSNAPLIPYIPPIAQRGVLISLRFQQRTR